ncbi:unnamed protein product [Effrenium voratum]|nr:unnamed protein product [Effrenium voratum]
MLPQDKGIKPLLVERCAIACAASGHAGGFLARGWGSGATEALHHQGFDLHEKLAKELDIRSYRRLPTLSVGGKLRRDVKDRFPWVDRAGAEMMDQETAQARSGLESLFCKGAKQGFLTVGKSQSFLPAKWHSLLLVSFWQPLADRPSHPTLVYCLARVTHSTHSFLVAAFWHRMYRAMSQAPLRAILLWFVSAWVGSQVGFLGDAVSKGQAQTGRDFRPVDVLIPNISDGEPIGSMKLTVFEATPEDSQDTYGSQLWPASVYLASRLLAMPLAGTRVLELGCGNGLCSLVAAQLGADVLATDYRQLPLDLLQAACACCGASLQTRVLDFAAPLPRPLDVSTPKRAELPMPPAPLPEHDLLLAADVGYSKALAWRLGQRCRESLERGARVMVCESRKMPDCRLAFAEALSLGRCKLRLQKKPALQVETTARQCLEDIPSVWFLDMKEAAM